MLLPTPTPTLSRFPTPPLSLPIPSGSGHPIPPPSFDPAVLPVAFAQGHLAGPPHRRLRPATPPPVLVPPSSARTWPDLAPPRSPALIPDSPCMDPVGANRRCLYLDANRRRQTPPPPPPDCLAPIASSSSPPRLRHRASPDPQFIYNGDGGPLEPDATADGYYYMETADGQE
ncbi:protein TRACHEARY ELEMENT DIFFERENTIATION-RELATED 7A [Triticum aestivum]|uniref:protein TRACHEARY ELEMENT DIFFERENTIATION-RELATED 7A n=1 Tax=Triticum aestivum TaxID=4565 RepID=UPI001D033955|nr:protein TRACHEARY ELEMENT DIFFERENTIATION-RELATED 7A-like [Triticum aestivum]